MANNNFKMQIVDGAGKVIRETTLDKFVGKVNLHWYPTVMQEFLGFDEKAAIEAKKAKLEAQLAALKK